MGIYTYGDILTAHGIKAVNMSGVFSYGHGGQIGGYGMRLLLGPYKVMIVQGIYAGEYAIAYGGVSG